MKSLWLLLIVLCAAPALAAAEPNAKVTIGIVPSQPGAATYIAVDKGYFRAAGIEVELQNLETASTAMALLASNRLQVVEGGFSAGYWNALAQGLPVIFGMERASTPLYHSIMVSPAMKDQIQTIADLKGRSMAQSGPGSVGAYEAGRMLESVGLTFKDVETKFISFTQMGLALKNGAVDAALSVPPFSSATMREGLAVHVLDPEDAVKIKPMSIIAYMINTDWAKQNADLTRRFFVAVVRGAREYCQAYHHGPNRDYVVDILLKNKVADRDLLENTPWPSRDPSGRFNPVSVADVQDWYYQEGFITQRFPVERLIDTSYAKYAATELGPFELVNKGSRLGGCR